MSGTAYNWHRYLGNPLPFYDDPATQQATGWINRAVEPITTGAGNPIYAAQDTGGIFGTPGSSPGDPGWRGSVDYTAESLPGGGGWSAPSTQTPYTAPSTTGGGTWDVPGWAYGGNQKGGGTYNAQTGNWDNGAPLAAGADVFGAKLPVGYDSAQDRGGLNLSGNNVETFWSKFLRLTKDLTDGGTPVQQAMQATLARLRKDNGDTLQGTGFQEGGTGAGTSGANTGGKTVDPSNGTGLPIPGGIPTAPTIPATGAGGAGGALNSIGGAELYNDPKLAWRYIMQQAGADPDYQGPFSGFMAQEYAPLMMAFLNARLAGAGRAPGAQGLAGMDQIGGMLGQFGGMLGGNDLYTKLGQAGQAGLAAGGGLLNQASSGDAENFVRQMLGLTGAGNGPLAQSAQQYLTNKMTGGYSDANLGQVKQGKFGDYLNSSGFLDRLRQLGLLP